VAGDVFKRARSLFGRSEPDQSPLAPKKKVNAYHAVTIAPGPRACVPAQQMRGKRFLSREAPALPLRNCCSAACECRYEHYDDRRESARRARDLGVSIDGYDGSEKRQKARRGRRTNDA
jgi:hypothetical protein